MATPSDAEVGRIDCSIGIPTGGSKAANAGSAVTNIMYHYDVTARSTTGFFSKVFNVFAITKVPTAAMVAIAKIGDRAKAFFVDSTKTAKPYDSDDFIYTRNGYVNLCGLAHEIDDPGTGVAIPVTSSGTVAITTGATGETNTLDAPLFVGQQLGFCLKTDGGGDRVVTYNTNKTLTFGDAGDTAVLMGIRLGNALAWAIVANSGVTAG
jgi:hypothetical protein